MPRRRLRRRRIVQSRSKQRPLALPPFMPPPIKPWIARQTIISLMDVDKPHITLASVKPAADVANTMRVPSARDRKPDSGIITTSAIRYDVCTQLISSAEETAHEVAETLSRRGRHGVAPGAVT